MTEDIHLFPYKIQVIQQLSEYSIERRVEFIEDIAAELDNPNFLNNIEWFRQQTKFGSYGVLKIRW